MPLYVHFPDAALPIAQKMLRQFEECRLTAYQDEGGIWTIGWGHTGDVQEGDTITQEHADYWLDADSRLATTLLDKQLKVRLGTNQAGALISFSYNIGANAFRNSTALADLNEGKVSAVPVEMFRWVHVKGKVSPGLVKRRGAEIALWFKADDPPSNSTDVSPVELAVLPPKDGYKLDPPAAAT